MHAVVFFLLVILIQGPNLVRSQSSLADGWITTQTDINSQASITLDARDIIKALNDGDIWVAKDIFDLGKHSYITDRNGEALEKRTIKGLSTSENFDENPNFLFHIYALSDRKPEHANGFRPYAHNFVRDLMNIEHKGVVGEGIAALILWMTTVNELWDGVRDCLKSERGINNSLTENAGGAYAIDEAMGYWVGLEQNKTKGGFSSYRGFSMYQLTQDAFVGFGGDPHVVAPANEKIKTLYEEAKELIAFQQCGAKTTTSESLFHIVNKMISVMYIPLLQKFIQAIKNADKIRVGLYSLSITPQIVACKASTHAFIRDKTRFYEKEDNDKILRALQSAYDCLGVTCNDIGDPSMDCEDIDLNAPLEGYNPTYSVHHHAKIDLDVLQIKILTELQNFHAAEEIYTYGKNSLVSNERQSFRSLRGFATATARSLVTPYFEEFSSYHDDDPDYADSLIGRALVGKGRFEKIAPLQRSAFVVNTIQYQVMYMYALTEFHKALDICDSETLELSQLEEMILFWDKGVAYFVGSIEGLGPGGTPSLHDGVLMYGLANERCEQFSTCDDGGRSTLIIELQDLFYKGKGFLNSKNCEGVKKTLQTIKSLSTVPLFQSIISTAIHNDNLQWNSKDVKLAQGETYALSVIPVIAFSDPSIAFILEKNMYMQNRVTPVEDGVQAVVEALHGSMSVFGVRCHWIGFTTVTEGDERIELCKGDDDVHDIHQYSATSSADYSFRAHSFFSSVLIPVVFLLS